MQSLTGFHKRTLTVLLWVMVLTLTIGTIVYSIHPNGAFQRLRYPYIFLVSIDTLNIKYTDPYNPGVGLTPELDRIARSGVLFERAYTHVPVTMPAHTSLLTGLTPIATGVMANGDVLSDRFTTLPEILRQRGYRTAAFVSLGVLKRSFGLHQGFEEYDDFFPETRWYRNADEIFRLVKRWVLNNEPRPFFVWVHFSDPHDPYLSDRTEPDTRIMLDNRVLGDFSLIRGEAIVLRFDLEPGEHQLVFQNIRAKKPDDRPDTGIRVRLLDLKSWKRWAVYPDSISGNEFDLEQPRIIHLFNPGEKSIEVKLWISGYLYRPPPSVVLPAYQEEVSRVDQYIQKLRLMMENLQLDSRTLWIIVSDHGEGLFNHDALGHTAFLYEDQLRVMWIMRGPGLPEGKRIDYPVVGLEDVVPTLLEGLGLDLPEPFSGRSLWECIPHEQKCPANNEFWAYGVSHDDEGITGVAYYLWPWKLMFDHRYGTRLYNLSKDPHETRSLLKGNAPLPPEFGRLKNQRDRLDRMLRDYFTHRNRQELTDTEREMLKSLGYIDTGN